MEDNKRPGWAFKDLDDCLSYQKNTSFSGFCNATWDGFLCWPISAPGTIASQLCPANQKGILRDRYASRICSNDGFWLNSEGQPEPDPAFTDYHGCFTPELTKVIKGFYENPEEQEIKENIVYSARIFEMVGYSISFASVLISLIILTSFRKLHTREKRIHRHLYWAMFIQVILRLILYTDQLISRRNGVIGDKRESSLAETENSNLTHIDEGETGGSNETNETHEGTFSTSTEASGIDNTPYLCESFYVLLEYARSAMFHWFFIEGLHLHNVLTISVFPSYEIFRIYYAVGWGLPVLMTAIWALVTGLNLDTSCWYGYNHTPYYYIVEGPRLAVIAINLLFLLNILRVLLTKLRNVNSGETKKVRKAVKAAIVLQPLLGITNSLQMMAAPYDASITYFASHLFLTTFLVSFQGFFAALFYCFLNGEVRNVLSKHFDVLRTQRAIDRRASMNHSMHQQVQHHDSTIYTSTEFASATKTRSTIKKGSIGFVGPENKSLLNQQGQN